MEKKERKRIVIVGDLFPVPSNYKRFEEGDVNYLIGDKITQLFDDADYRICNLEGTLTDGAEQCEKTGPVVLAPTNAVNAIKAMGINCCMLANNHITDAGHQGVIDTIKTINHAGLEYLGAGNDIDSIIHHKIVKIGQISVGLYNVCETMYNQPSKKRAGAYIYDEYLVCKELENIKKKCDYIIVIYHGGAEKFRYPSPQTRKRFHRMVDSGADMILSQHTHCVGSEEYYKGAYLLYGQGNFLFRSFNNEFTNTGLIIELVFDNGKPMINKHLVRAIADTVRYDDKQDFGDFVIRSQRIDDEDYITQKYDEYCMSELATYLSAFKSRFLGRSFLRRFFPKVYKYYLINKGYDRYNLLFTLHTLRSEQNRETAVRGIEVLLGL